MPYHMPVPTREEWQKLRDNAKVPKGAAKVSIGDAIAKVHKSFTPKTISANVKDTGQLISDLTTYMAAIKPKYQAFESVVKTKVKGKAESHLRFLNDIVKARTEYYPRYSAATETWKAYKNGTGKPKDFAAKLAALKGCVDAFALLEAEWEQLRPQVQKIFQLCDTVPTLNDTQKGAVETLLNDLKL